MNQKNMDTAQNKDTVNLLSECNSGIQMAVQGIEEVLNKICDDKLKKMLNSSLNEHKRLGDETHEMLLKYGEEVQEAHPIAKEMSKIKTNVKMAFEENDETVADLISDGCHMGTKSLSKYLNQYKKAEEKAKDIAKKLISMEDDLESKLRVYL